MTETKTAFSFSTLFRVYGLAVILPLLLTLGVFLLETLSDGQKRIERQLLQAVHDLEIDLERDFDRHMAVLETLSTSELLTAENWPAFHQRAKAALEGRAYLVLVDAEGRQLVNTYVRYGEQPEMTGDPESVRRILATGDTVVSNVFTSLVAKAPVINISMPIRHDGQIRYVMSLGLLPTEFRKILEGQSLDPDWVSTVFDARGAIVAQSRDHERVVGAVLPEPLRVDGRGRVERAELVEGEQMWRIVVRLPQGWGIAVNAPATTVRKQLIGAASFWVAITVGSLALSLWLALLLGRRVAGPIAEVSAAAAALGRGEPVSVRPSRFKEANMLSEALLKAQRDLKETGRALDATRAMADATAAELQSILDQSKAAIWVARGPGTLRGNPAAKLMWSGSADPNLSAIEAAVDAKTFRGDVEIGVDELPLMRAQRLGVTVEDTLKIVRRDGSAITVTGSATPLKDERGAITGAAAVFMDISALVEAEAHRELLIQELRHRVKNTLTVVQSIAMQTMKVRPDPRDFAEAFTSRLASLARAHDLFTASAAKGALLGETVETALAAFKSSRNAIEIEGNPVVVAASAAITLNLMLHELATNAVKYGALSVPTGRIGISWKIAPGAAAPVVTLGWVEKNGPKVAAPSRAGFGTRLLSTGAEQLGGDIDIQYTESGLRCTLRFQAATGTQHQQRTLAGRGLETA